MPSLVYRETYNRSGEKVHDEIWCIKPKSSGYVGSFCLRRVTEAVVAGEIRQQFYVRVLTREEEAAFVGTYCVHSHNEMCKTNLEEEHCNHRGESGFWRIFEIERGLTMREKYLEETKYHKAYLAYPRCDDTSCGHPKCIEYPLDDQHPFSTLNIPLSPDIYEDITGRRPYKIFFSPGYRQEFSGAEGQSFLPRPDKPDPGPYSPEMLRKAEEAKEARVWKASVGAVEKNRCSWDDEAAINVSRDEDWETKAVARAKEERAEGIMESRAKASGAAKSKHKLLVKIEFK